MIYVQRYSNTSRSDDFHADAPSVHWQWSSRIPIAMTHSTPFNVATADDETPNLLDSLCRLAARSLSVDAAVMYESCDDNSRTWRAASTDNHHQLEGDDAVFASVANDELTVIEDTLDDPGLRSHVKKSGGALPRFIAAVPLDAPGKTALWGHLLITDDEPRQMQSSDQQLLWDLAITAAELLAHREMRNRASTVKKELRDERQQRRDLITDLQRSNRKLEQFAYVASHDLQEPLRMVTSFLGLLEEEYKGELDDDADEYIEFAVDGARRMQTMIDDLLTYSRVGSSQEPFVEVNVEEAFVAARDEVLLDHDDVTIEHRPLPTVQGRFQQLQRLFSNLLTNAVIHSGPAPHIDVDWRQEDDRYLFSVADQGMGIPQDQQERIFDIFISSDARSEQHSGLGLAICTSIVEEHGGRLWVDSIPGEGATFYFTLATEPGQ